LLLLFTFAKGVLWAISIAPLDAPDEPSHFNYIAQVREGYWLPVVDLVSPGGLRTPPSTPLNADVRAWFAQYDYKFFRSMPYESAQPPLYYWLAAAWTRPLALNAGNLPLLLFVARLFSVLLGTGAVLALWLACRFAFATGGLPWAAALALTLNPEFSFTTATVSNDAGMIFWGAALLAVWGYGLRASRTMDDGRWTMDDGGRVQTRSPRALPLMALAALITAAGILTKLTFVATVPATLLWLLWLAWQPSGAKDDGRWTMDDDSAHRPSSIVHRPRERPRPGLWLVYCLVTLGAVALLVVPWAVRNMRVYGEPTGARAIFDLIHNIYWDRLNFPDSQWFSQFPLDAFVARSFRSFWALFGWATVWLSDWVYWILAAFALLAFVGLAARLWRSGTGLFAGNGARLCLLAALTCLLAFANYVAYNSLVEFQPHMRYTFVALAPATMLLVVGLGRSVWGDRMGRALVAIFLVVLAAVHLASLIVLWDHTQYVLNSAG
jgi:hypothetical protein